MEKKVRSKDDLEYFRQSRPEMLSYIPAECSHFLELGCSEGRFGSLMKKDRHCTYHGIELVKEAAGKAAKNLDKVYTNSITEILPELASNYYDCIICNDVLEHLEDPYSCLEKLKRVLKFGGYVVSSIPNVRYINNLRELIFQKDWEYRHEGILDFTHLRFFTQKSIRRMYMNTGYDVIKNEGLRGIDDFRFSLLNALTLGFFKDTLYLQIATVAKLNRK